jgi:hypothetical protein
MKKQSLRQDLELRFAQFEILVNYGLFAPPRMRNSDLRKYVGCKVFEYSRSYYPAANSRRSRTHLRLGFAFRLESQDIKFQLYWED